MKPSFLESQIKDLKAHVKCLESYLAQQRKRHKKLDDGNGTYDPIEYHAFQLFIHTALIRSRLNLKKSKAGADGKGKQFCTLHDGSMMKCYEDPE